MGHSLWPYRIILHDSYRMNHTVLHLLYSIIFTVLLKRYYRIIQYYENFNFGQIFISIIYKDSMGSIILNILI